MGQRNFELLDLLTVASFLMQVQNQMHIVGISDVQEEVNRAVDAINAHLEAQDEKISRIMEVLDANDNETV